MILRAKVASEQNLPNVQDPLHRVPSAKDTEHPVGATPVVKRGRSRNVRETRRVKVAAELVRSRPGALQEGLERGKGRVDGAWPD